MTRPIVGVTVFSRYGNRSLSPQLSEARADTATSGKNAQRRRFMIPRVWHVYGRHGIATAEPPHSFQIGSVGAPNVFLFRSMSRHSDTKDRACNEASGACR